jgi:RHS repeat-associated protein
LGEVDGLAGNEQRAECTEEYLPKARRKGAAPHASGELVEYATYQSYGQTDSNYRPARWGEFRETYKFGGKEEDVEVGLAYFGARYLSLGLGRWISPDPVTIHALRGDLNPYAYVAGRPLVAVDPDGREIFTLIAIGIAVGALIGGASSAVSQYSATGSINWGWSRGGVLQAMAVGAVAGGVSAGVGGCITGAITGSVQGSGGVALAALVSGPVAGAAGGAASYAASAVFSGNMDKMSAQGLGESIGWGAALGGASGVLNATAVGLTEWDALIGAPAAEDVRRGVTPGGFIEGAVVGMGQGAVALAFAKAIHAPDWLAAAAGGIGFYNGMVAGARGVYNFGSPTGWLAAGLDATVGLPGTALGHISNVVSASGTYLPEHSYRQNRQVYQTGLGLKDGYAFTAGNVISNQNPASASLMNHHETLHIWQSRLFGPVYQATYLVHGAGGGIAGGVIAGFSGENVSRGMEAGGYMSNPFEYFAYSNQGTWGDWAARYPAGLGW